MDQSDGSTSRRKRRLSASTLFGTILPSRASMTGLPVVKTESHVGLTWNKAYSVANQ